MKLRRAKELYNDLSEAMSAFSDEPSISVLTRADGDIIELVMGETAEPPLSWSVIIGEIVHDLRSALDHSVYAVATHQTKVPPGRDAGFPVYYDKARFLSRGRRQIAALTPEAQAFVAEWQPFHGLRNGQPSGEHPLGMLQELWNIDKHRTLHLATLVAGIEGVRHRSSDPDAVVVEYVRDGVITTGDVLARVRILRESSGASQLEIEKYSQQIAFRDLSLTNAPYVSVPKTLETLGNLSASIVKGFERFCS